MKSLGICLGASSVSIAEVETNGDDLDAGRPVWDRSPRLTGSAVLPHDGNPKKTLLQALDGLDLAAFDRVAATGRKFRRIVRLSSIPEPQAVELAYQFTRPANTSCPAVVSAGGETFMAYVLNASGRISNVLTGNKCASGTGEFFLQQLRRMDVSLEEAARWAVEEEPYFVSGRCSVFCKSDCTHATNKGIPKSKVTAGLCRMMADKIMELLKRVERRNVMVIGGTTRNRMMVEYLKREIPGLVIPGEAPFFEALGAALWAQENKTITTTGHPGRLFTNGAPAFASLPPLENFSDQVTFKTMEKGRVSPGQECILGLDVGSTTTKAVLMDKNTRSLLASIYLRTNGDPVGASRQCYQAILDQVSGEVDPEELTIAGLGVCGSGRQIAGLHALTDGIINEIVAHAAAAVYFDPEVDTLFEIGGQDAKYTYITNGVPSDYAMNEACSAGTGSFLEESALESLGVAMQDIAAIAMQGAKPPNFNDQCAAFIASDIKNAIHEGIGHADIVAGLVYSICMNYANRVKGNRAVGRKVLMQGGVCYNQAVPLAMASIVGKPIIVPPDPGLTGAFGVALEVGKRLDLGLMQKKSFSLAGLAAREVNYGREFTCKGGKEKCDRKCTIAMVELEGRQFPFGGACNRYYNLRHHKKYDVVKLDLVRKRQEIIFGTPAANGSDQLDPPPRGGIGFNRSFLVNTYYPLYARFFSRIGFAPVMADKPSRMGIEQRNAAFCYPAELAHGFFHSLIEMETPPDYIFLPHFKSIPLSNGDRSSQVCPLVQGETFYLQSAFRERLKELEQTGTRVLAPLLDLNQGLEKARTPLLKTAQRMGIGHREANPAFDRALDQQENCLAGMKRIGNQALAALEKDPDQIGVVIFSRPYNGLVDEAHMGIPAKFASRGVMVIPFDFLPFEKESSKRHMYWGMGEMIMKSARLVRRHPQLFGTFITNFSCGPDSFIIGYFRSVMGQKPSLTLELDSHTADAGLDTRIDAFLDIVSAYQQLERREKPAFPSGNGFAPATTTLEKGIPTVVTTSGEKIPLIDPRVTLLVPSMGKLGSEAIAAVFRGTGVNAIAHPPADEGVLKTGRGSTSCKECLPLILTTGTLLNYIQHQRKSGEVVVYLMATGTGPCRFGQYYIFIEDLIRRLEIPDIAVFTLTSENSYLGLDKNIERKTWWGIVVSDIMEDMRAMLLTNAIESREALEIFHSEWVAVLKALENGAFRRLEHQLQATALNLGRIKLKMPAHAVPTISLTGEIFVRRDDLSRQNLTERLAQKGFATVCTPVAEWVFYSEYLVDHGLVDQAMPFLDKIRFKIRKKIMATDEQRLRSILAASGLVNSPPIDVSGIIENARPYISRNLTGEAVLTIGGSLTDIATHACGVIAIGPFGCMPNRLAEAIMHETMCRENKLKSKPVGRHISDSLEQMDDLPFLAIESDGSPFPQIIEAKFEAFCLRARRMHEQMLRAGVHHTKSS
ncbi:MAG: acyl-CoA dehydratase activase [Thermodesulfobacteriota bacterium]